MKNKLLIFIILLSLFIYLGISYNNELNKFLEEDSIYLIFRGTDSKYGKQIINFNEFNNFENHVGVLVYENKNWYVFHYINSNPNGILKEELNTFINFKNITHYSFWKVNTLKNDVNTSNFLNNDKYNSIKYDLDFSLENSDLYCSEFVSMFLKNLDSVNFNFMPNKKRLGSIFKSFFNRDSLIYYPVDIFQKHPDIIKIYEWKK